MTNAIILDMSSIPTSPVVDLVHSHIKLSCDSTALRVSFITLV